MANDPMDRDMDTDDLNRPDEEEITGRAEEDDFEDVEEEDEEDEELEA